MRMETSKRIRRTIIMGSSWLVAILLFLAFNPMKLSFWQSTAALVTSGLITVSAVALTWISPRM